MKTNNDAINKPTVLAVGLFVSGTGFTRVFETLFTQLSKHFSIHWMGIGYKGPVTTHEHYTLYPVNAAGGDIYGAYGAAALSSELNVKSILLLTDFYLLKNYRRPLQPLKEKGIRLVAYVPLDGSFIDSSLIEDCLFLDALVLYNQWALQEVAAAGEKYQLEKNAGDSKMPEMNYIYHGTDTAVFSAAASGHKKQELKKALFNVPDAADSIFILNANRFNERKAIPATITAFAKAMPRFNQPAYLCLHTPGLNSITGSNLLTEIENSGCKERILLNPLGDAYCTNEELTQLYSACDIGVNTSLGEGWGMISFEHAACGAAQLVPDHTAPSDLWKDAGILIPTLKSIQLNTNPFLMYNVNTDVLATELVQLVNDKAYLNKTAAACFVHAKKEMFSWQTIAQQWVKKLR
ncbi:MAG: glycosyltransferase [Chitinophagaceae bacterium]|nr:glycosyltransferase [Chitinophagaceae bacterium]MBL0201951.1 glycosyltransferase [Chitinophagaceae bacterium]